MCWYLLWPKCSNHKDTCIIWLCRHVCTYEPLQQCLSLLHQLQHLIHLHLSFIKPQSNCHSPHMTVMQLTRCMSLDCSSASLILGSSFARSRLRNTWTTYSASWARKGIQLWTTGSQLMKPTNKI